MSNESSSSPRRSSGRPRTAPNYEMLNSGTYTIEDITEKKGNKKNTTDEIGSAINSNSQDTHTCGDCKEQFSDLTIYVAHKQGGCPALQPPPAKKVKSNPGSSANWESLKTKDEILNATIRNVPSRLHPPFRAKQLKRHMVTGEELGRRICGPEKLTDVHTLAKYLSVGTAADNKGHCQRELKRIIQVMSDKRREMPIFSAFSVLTEGDVAYLAEDVKAVGAMTIDTCEVANLIKPSLGETEEGQKQQSLNIRNVMKVIMAEIKKTDFDTMTHGGNELLQALYAIFDDVLFRI